MTLQNAANDYSKYCEVNINQKLIPVNKSIDDMLARLEEFQTMLTFVTQDRIDYSDILTSIPNYKNDFNDLCNKIDVVENLVSHIKANLDKLENDVEKAETDLKITDPTVTVSNIFTPLFKKQEKRLPTNTELFKTECYFN